MFVLKYPKCVENLHVCVCEYVCVDGSALPGIRTLTHGKSQLSLQTLFCAHLQILLRFIIYYFKTLVQVSYA